LKVPIDAALWKGSVTQQLHSASSKVKSVTQICPCAVFSSGMKIAQLYGAGKPESNAFDNRPERSHRRTIQLTGFPLE
jgi:hypothetical protein